MGPTSSPRCCWRWRSHTWRVRHGHLELCDEGFEEERMHISTRPARKSSEVRLPSQALFLLCLSYHRKAGFPEGYKGRGSRGRSHVNPLAGKMGWPCHIPGGLASGDGRTEDLDPQLECFCWLEPWPVLSSCHTLWKGKTKRGTGQHHLKTS